MNNVAAVPELSTCAILIVDFAGLGFMGYRRSRNSLVAASAKNQRLLETRGRLRAVFLFAFAELQQENAAEGLPANFWRSRKLSTPR
jgi:hypothetical protein